MKRFLKIFLKLIVYLLAAIGALTVFFLIAVNKVGYSIELNIANEQYEEYVDLLRNSGPYKADAANLDMKITIDQLRAAQIKEYFQLDTLYSADADTWSRALAIGEFVATNIPHANQKEYPKSVDAIGLWEYTKSVEPAFNCRLHSIMTFELLSSVGIKARYITCLPKDENDRDCHVVNEVWLPEMNKWVMLDTDMGGHYVTDGSGRLLSLREMREHYIADKEMIFYPGFRNGSAKKTYYYKYMAKNTYWFALWNNLGFYQEDYENHPNQELRDKYYGLVPSGFNPFTKKHNKRTAIATNDVEQFWK
ncbi:MAG: transglutaminase domain-containing protein [Alistipes sp.]|nr:transglutaminase domain-containing protein [Alistipes sp.]